MLPPSGSVGRRLGRVSAEQARRRARGVALLRVAAYLAVLALWGPMALWLVFVVDAGCGVAVGVVRRVVREREVQDVFRRVEKVRGRVR